MTTATPQDKPGQDPSTMSANADLAAFYQMCKELLVPDNSVRKAAEKKLESLTYHQLFKSSYEVFQSNEIGNEKVRDQIKLFLCTQIKNQFATQSHTLASEVLQEYASDYLVLLNNITNIPVENVKTLHSFVDILGNQLSFALSKSVESKQAEFVNHTLNTMKSVNDAITPLLAVNILSSCMESCSMIGIKHETIMQNFNQFIMKYSSQLENINDQADESTIDIANNFFKYSSGFLSKTMSVSNLNESIAILVSVAIHIIVKAKLHTICGSVIESLHQVAQIRPRLFKTHIKELIDLVIYTLLIKSSNFSEEQNHISAINFLSTLFNDMAGKFMTHKDKLDEFINHCVRFMAVPDEQDNYEEVEDDEDFDQRLDHISRQSEIVFDKMCVKAPEFMFPYVQSFVSQFLKPGSSVEQMYAGLNILCCSAEGCTKQFESNLEDIVKNYVLPYTFDSEYPAKVRFAALTTLGQLCSDFGNVLVTRLFDDVVEAYFKALINNKSEKVQCHAFTALNNFIEVSSQWHLPKIIKRLTPAFQSVLQRDFSKKTYNAILDTIISFSEKDVDLSELYYATREKLMQISEKTLTSDLLPLFGRTVLAVCSLGKNADRDTFRKDSFKLFETSEKVVKSMSLEQRDTFETFDSLLISWEIMIKTFEFEFKDYIKFILEIMYQVINTANENISEMPSPDEDFANISDLRDLINKKSAQSGEAVLACQLIQTVCSVFKKDVGNMMLTFIELFLQICDSKYHLLLASVYKAISSIILTLDEKHQSQIWPQYIKLTFENLSNQIDGASFYEFVSAFMDVVEALGPNSINETILQDLVNRVIIPAFDTQYEESIKQAKAQYYKDNEEFEEYDALDEDFYPDDQIEEHSLVVGLNALTHTLFSILKDKFIPYFDAYKDKSLVYFDREKYFPETHVDNALHVWVGIIENSTPKILETYKDLLIKVIDFNLQDPNVVAFHTAAFGYGVLAEKIEATNQAFDPFLQKCLPILVRHIENYHQDNKALSGDEQFHVAMDNVVSALIRIIRFKSHLLGSKKSELTKELLQFLPFKHDLDELPNCFDFISGIIESFSSLGSSLTTADRDILSKLAEILLDSFIIGNKIIPSEKLHAYAIVLKNAAAQISELQQIVSQMDKERQVVFENILKIPAPSN